MKIQRADIDTLIKKLSISPGVAILGARQVGKTTLALQAAEMLEKPFVYLDLESGQDLAKISDDPESYFDFHKEKLVIIDEIQAYPILFTRLRSVIDKHRVNGRFLLLGSASPHLVKGVSESLAGRISYLDLNPFRLLEIFPEFSQQRHWFRGGFPGTFLAESDTNYQDWVESFVRSYIERDLNLLFGYSFNPVLAKRLWQMLAHYHGQLFNAEELSRSLGISSPAVNRYVDFMVGAFLVYKISPWFANSGKRLVKSPKIYVKDSGIVHFLTAVKSYEELLGNPIIGASWEGYVMEQILYHKPQETDVYYYRTHTGTEIDAVLVKGNQPIGCIEIKFSNAPSISKGFFIGIEDLQTTKNFVITPSSDSYPHKGSIVCSLVTFLQDYLPEL